MHKFDLTSNFTPCGDQQAAIDNICEGIQNGLRSTVLRGVTGSGKTFTMANIIQKVQRPTLVIAHNKTLAAQLCNEFREFFPNNRVEFFVSYYDYYQPESYLPSSDTYIEKDMSINDEIDKLRNSATCSLAERRDTIVVASVSCIYGLGAPEEYFKLALSIRENDELDREVLIRKLVAIQYERCDSDFHRSTFRVRGDTLEIFPAHLSEYAYRIEFFGDTVERICEFEAISGKVKTLLKHVVVFPATHYAVEQDKLKSAIRQIETDLETQYDYFFDNQKLIEAHRIKQRTSYDIEMMSEMGYCSGIENYSRYFDGRKQGEPPFTLLSYFPKDFIVFVDESHMTLPQIRAMYAGDKARKTNLVEYGFRLPSAFDNRPLNFKEFDERITQAVYVSATPAEYELSVADNIVEQIIRPTGLVDPVIEVRKTEGQIDDLIFEIKSTIKKGGRTLITTLTKRMSEHLSTYLTENGLKVSYLHSEINTLERIQIINSLRAGEFDVLVGINLLREGLDMPEVMLVAILDADKEGFLRSETSLIQTIGRAARNSESKVVMYADRVTDSMNRAIRETNRRREIQLAHNKKYGITPKTIIKNIKNTLEISKSENIDIKVENIPEEIEKLKSLMAFASSQLDFEKAIEIRERIKQLKLAIQGSPRKK